MEKIDYKKIFVNNIIGVYGISSYDFLSNIKNTLDENLKVSYINSENFEFCTNNFKSEMKFKIGDKNVNKKEVREKLFEYCNDFLIEEELLSRKITNLSSSEKYIVYIILNLLLDSDIYIFNNIYKYLDKNNIKKLIAVLKRLKELGKTVIIFDDINVLFEITFEIYLFKEGKLVFSGNTKEVLTNVEKLIKKKMDVPDLPLITYLAKKKKGVKLFYHTDVRDIIKDVYKHV